MIDKTKCINIFLDNLDKNLKQITIDSKLKVIKQFLDYCIIKEINNVKSIRKEDVYNTLEN